MEDLQSNILTIIDSHNEAFWTDYVDLKFTTKTEHNMQSNHQSSIRFPFH